MALLATYARCPPPSPPPASANGRVQPDASSPDHVVEYGGLTIILPGKLARYHTFLIARQKYAIDQGAVYDVPHSSLVCPLAWALQEVRKTCAHVNLSPVQRDKVPYERNDHVVLFLKNDLVVAGVFLCSDSQISQLQILRRAHLEDPGWYGFLAYHELNELENRQSELERRTAKIKHDFANDLRAMAAMITSTSALPSLTNLVGEKKRKRQDSETSQRAAQRIKEEEEAVLTCTNAGLGEGSYSGVGDTSWQANDSVSYKTEFLVPNTLFPTIGSTTHLNERLATTSAHTVSIQYYQTLPQDDLQEDNIESNVVEFTLDDMSNLSKLFMPPSTPDSELIDRWPAKSTCV